MNFVSAPYLLPLERFSLNFGQMLIPVRWCAEPMTQLCRLMVKVTIKGSGGYLLILCPLHIFLDQTWDFMIQSWEYLHGWHRLEKYLNIQVCLEKSLKIKSALKGTGKSLKSLEQSLNSAVFCWT